MDLLRPDLLELSEEKRAEASVESDGHLFDHGYLDSLTAVAFRARVEQRFCEMI